MHLETRIKELEKEVQENREQMKQYREIISSLTKTLENVTLKNDDGLAKTKGEDVQQIPEKQENVQVVKKEAEKSWKFFSTGKPTTAINNKSTQGPFTLLGNAATLPKKNMFGNGVATSPFSKTTSATSTKASDHLPSTKSPGDEHFLVLQDTMRQNGELMNVKTKVMSITSKMIDKCVEELRLENYLKNKDTAINDKNLSAPNSMPFGAFHAEKAKYSDPFASKFNTTADASKAFAPFFWESTNKSESTTSPLGKRKSETDKESCSEGTSTLQKGTSTTSKNDKSFPSKSQVEQDFYVRPDVMTIFGVSTPVLTKCMNINGKPENWDKSIEELRWDHQLENKDTGNVTQNSTTSVSATSKPFGAFPSETTVSNSSSESDAVVANFRGPQAVSEICAHDTSANQKNFATTSGIFKVKGSSMFLKPQKNVQFSPRKDIIRSSGSHANLNPNYFFNDFAGFCGGKPVKSTEQTCRTCNGFLDNATSTKGERKCCSWCATINITGVLGKGNKWFMCYHCTRFLQAPEVGPCYQCKVCHKFGSTVDVSHLKAHSK